MKYQLYRNEVVIGERHLTYFVEAETIEDAAKLVLEGKVNPVAGGEFSQASISPFPQNLVQDGKTVVVTDAAGKVIVTNALEKNSE